MSTMREVQMCALGILKEVVRVCEKYQLTYYLNFGTLLGAVRHNGFIPWDDDIDIEMPIKDYRKFLKVAPKEISKDLFVQTYKSEPAFNLLWTQVRANNTTSMPIKYKNWDIHWGMLIDIFPLVGVPKNKFGKNIQKKGLELSRILINKEYLLACEPEEIKRNKKLKLIYRLPRSLRVALCNTILKMILRDPFKSNSCAALERELTFELASSAYNSKINIEFEGKLFAAPKEYDYVLTTIYGDYMTPPPESERLGHEGTHGEIIRDHTTDFSVYRRQELC